MSHNHHRNQRAGTLAQPPWVRLVALVIVLVFVVALTVLGPGPNVAVSVAMAALSVATGCCTLRRFA